MAMVGEAKDDEYPQTIPDLIPSLPSDVALSCLHRLPIHTLPILSQVSRAWRSVAAKTDAFFSSRRCQGYTRRYVCLLLNQANHLKSPPLSGPSIKSPPCYGISLYDFHEHHLLAPEPLRIPLLPGFDAPGLPLFCRCISAGHRLVVLGGWHPVTWSPLPSVFIFDLATGLWSRGSDMPSPARSLFAAEALESAGHRVIIVAGGHNPYKVALSSAIAYDLGSDTWSPLPNMTLARDECKAIVMGGKFVAVSGYSHMDQGRFLASCEAYDLGTGKWEVLAEDMWPGGGRNPSSAMVLNGELHALVDRKLMKWTGRSSGDDGKLGHRAGRWDAVLDLPAEIAMATCVAPIPNGGIMVSGFSGGGGEAFGVALWRCELGSDGNARSWRRASGKTEGMGSVAQHVWSVEV